jgi:hypothetical protein
MSTDDTLPLSKRRWPKHVLSQLFITFEFVCQRAGIIHFPQRFTDGRRIDGNGARLFV